MRAVHVLFYEPQSDDYWLNHVVTMFSPPYSHCDIQFEDGVASSIYQNETVYMYPKQFSRLNYKRVSLTFTDSEYERILQFCRAAHGSKIGFDLPGMLCAYLPWGSRRPQDRTFCSRYVCEALQCSARTEFGHLEPSRVTPSTLHALLVGTNKSFLHVSESRMKNIV